MADTITIASDVDSNLSRCDVGNPGHHSSLEVINPPNNKVMNWFARILAHYSCVVLLVVAVFAGSCLIVPLIFMKTPDFSDPQMGYGSQETSTILAPNMTALDNLPEDVTGVVRTGVSSIPGDTESTPTWVYALNTSEVFQGSNDTDRNRKVDPIAVLKEMLNSGINPLDHDHNHQHISSDGFFCSSPSAGYSRVVFSATGGGDLFTLDSILSMCHIEAQMIASEEYHTICESTSHEKCCHSWSLGNYIAFLHNRPSCFAVTSEDVDATKALLQMCSHYYHNLTLTPDCQEESLWFCKQVPQQCRQHNAVYNIMYYLVDANFLPPNNCCISSLVNTMLILPIARSSATLAYYHSLDLHALQHGNVEVVAMDFGLKSTLFHECLVQDTWMIGAGGTFVLVCMWLYTGSLFVTIMTVIAVAFSLGMSYFMYTVIFELHFFPFMNLLATIVAVGIGADDAFIFCKVWRYVKAEKNSGISVELVHDALKHATPSMFVTSLTTASAFYASYISSITAIRCFSVFAGTATLANFVLMLTWLPAAVVVSEQWCFAPMVPPRWFTWHNKLRPAVMAAGQARALLDKFLVLSITKLHYLWLCLLGGIALGSIGVVFYYPRLKLPDSRNFQLFDSQHPFERYDVVYRDNFWFERLKMGSNEDALTAKMPLRFVWGILPIDNGDYLDPRRRGTIVYDDTFDMAAPESQRWLLRFCRRLKMQSFYQSMPGPLLPNCFIVSFKNWMQRRCRDPVNHIDRTPCCENSVFPYKRRVFEMCIVQAIADLYETPLYLRPGVAGLKFSDGKRPKIRALIVEYDSNHSYSPSFSEMDDFFQEVESWTRKELSEAPPGMRNGWFVSDLEFYDLQCTLSLDTLVSIGVSMAVALGVLLLVTLNVFISLYAILTILCIIFVTVAVLVLFGWTLNVLESIAISIAIGLSVDFSLHYGVHYRMCSAENRELAITYAVSCMGGPTAMAALTTAAAGAFMLPSTVLAYIQIGMFLVIVMTISWMYSTFFLGSLLCVGGPQHGFGQFSYTRCIRGDRSNGNSRAADRVNKTVHSNVFSDSTLSTSSTGCALHPSTSESHELEALNVRIHRGSFNRRLRRSGSTLTTLPSSASLPLSHCATTRKVSLPTDQSSSAPSAATVILVDDRDVDSRPTIADATEEPLMRY
ncbi:protein dispatched isoform X3 [Cryptotermes secundus]|uniref:protein dispatched isoform X3 n=1 Tax=Cryptotermes secundus TaxID=105785 RepID=UPI000CD7D682|nr:protein dispatched isoform X3 [Cryptotermes secundus]